MKSQNRKLYFLSSSSLNPKLISFCPSTQNAEITPLTPELSIKSNTRAIALSPNKWFIVGGSSNVELASHIKVRSDRFFIFDPIQNKILNQGRIRNKLSDPGLVCTQDTLFILGGHQDFCEENSYNCFAPIDQIAKNNSIGFEYFGSYKEGNKCGIGFFYEGAVWGIDQNFNFYTNSWTNRASWMSVFARIVDLGVPSGIAPIPRKASFAIYAENKAFLFDMKRQEIIFLLESNLNSKFISAKFVGCLESVPLMKEKLTKKISNSSNLNKQKYRLIDNSKAYNILILVDDNFTVYYYDLNRQFIIEIENKFKNKFVSKKDKEIYQNPGVHMFDILEKNTDNESKFFFIQETVNLDDPEYLTQFYDDTCQSKTSAQPDSKLKKETKIIARHLGSNKYPSLCTIYSDGSYCLEPISLCNLHHKIGFQFTNLTLNDELILIINMGYILLFSCSERKIVDFWERTDFCSHPILPNVAVKAFGSNRFQIYLIGSTFNKVDSFEEILVEGSGIQVNALKAPESNGKGSIFCYGNNVYLLNEEGALLKFDRPSFKWEKTIFELHYDHNQKQFKNVQNETQYSPLNEKVQGEVSKLDNDFVDPYVMKVESNRFLIAAVWLQKQIKRNLRFKLEFPNCVENYVLKYLIDLDNSVSENTKSDFEIKNASTAVIDEAPVFYKMDLYNIDQNIFKFKSEILAVNGRSGCFSTSLRKVFDFDRKTKIGEVCELIEKHINQIPVFVFGIYSKKGVIKYNQIGVHCLA